MLHEIRLPDWSEMGRRKNKNGEFVPVGLKIRHAIIRLLYDNPTVSARVPSTRQLALEYKLSERTVASELKKLREEKWIITRRGSGIFTNPNMANFQHHHIGHKIIGILIGDSRVLINDYTNWAIQSYCGLDLCPLVGHPRNVILSSNSPENIYEELRSQNFDGLIWGFPPENMHKHLVKLLRNGLPVIAVYAEVPGIPCLLFDNEAIGREMGRLLIQEKRRRLFWCSINSINPQMQMSSCLDFMKENASYKFESYDFRSIHTCADEFDQMIASGVIPDAVYAHGEYLFTVLQLMKKHGLDPVSQCRVICEGGMVRQLPDFHGITYTNDFSALAGVSADLMRQMLAHPGQTYENIILPTKVKLV